MSSLLLYWEPSEQLGAEIPLQCQAPWGWMDCAERVGFSISTCTRLMDSCLRPYQPGAEVPILSCLLQQTWG